MRSDIVHLTPLSQASDQKFEAMETEMQSDSFFQSAGLMDKLKSMLGLSSTPFSFTQLEVPFLLRTCINIFYLLSQPCLCCSPFACC